jgi:hypothetical protein
MLRDRGQRRSDQAPLLRFRPLQRLPARDALVRAAMLDPIPLRRFPKRCPPARPRIIGAPLVAHAVFRFANAMR